MTGDIRFNEDGRRENYTLSVMEMTVDSGLVKVADWSDRYGLVQLKKNAGSGGIGDRVQARVDYERNRTYVVTTIIEEPYLMLRKGKPGKVLEGNELYEGYCKDLADLIAHKLGINCTYTHTLLVSQSAYGELLALNDLLRLENSHEKVTDRRETPKNKHT